MAVATRTLDPITYEVLSHRLQSINEEGATTIVRASGSPVVHATDYNFGLYTADGDMAVSGVFYMFPIFVMQLVIAEIQRKFENIGPGDVFVMNDPFVAGIHQPDVQFVSPFYHEGEIVAWTGCMAHLMDLGGMYPGSWCPGATDVYQEGLRIPAARIVTAGELNHGVWDLILANSRLEAQVANDMSAFLSAHRVAQARLTEVCERYGADAVKTTMDTTIDRTEERLRAWLLELPDGQFQHSALMEHDGHDNVIYKCACTLTKAGDSLTFDFAGTDPVIPGLGNSTKASTFGGIGTAMMGVFGSALPWTAGLMRPVTIVAPDNSLVSAEPPAPVSAASTGGTWLVTAVAQMCISKLLAFSEKYRDFVCGPTDAAYLLGMWGGINQFGEGYATMHLDMIGWGGPGFSYRDGVNSGASLSVVGGGFTDVEHTERTQPVLYLWRREQVDSGGPGRHRGGNGIEVGMCLYGTETPTTATAASMGLTVPIALGVFGGYTGSTSMYEFISDADYPAQLAAGQLADTIGDVAGTHEYPQAKCTMTIAPGAVLNHTLQNAGGFGDPLERDPEAVRSDVAGGYVSPEAAHEFYGVVISKDAVDTPATEAARAAIAERRLDGLQNRRDSYERRDLPVIQHWGPVLSLVRDGDEILVQATESGAILGPLGDDWRAVAPWRTMSADELGPFVRVDDRLEIRQYVDPLTARSLWIDVQRRGEAWPVDFSLSPSSLS